jgi:acyl-CoA synthetase (AMP-forming)/AMP-acid ligase II
MLMFDWAAFIAARVQESADRYPERIAFSDHLAVIRYFELANSMRRLKEQLPNSSILFRDPVAIYLPHSSTAAACMISLMGIGISGLMMNTISPPEEIKALLKRNRFRFRG